MMTTMYAVRKPGTHPKEPVFVDIDDMKEFTWIEPLQKIIEERLNEPDYKTVWLTSTKVRNNGLLGLALCFKFVPVTLNFIAVTYTEINKVRPIR